MDRVSEPHGMNTAWLQKSRMVMIFVRVQARGLTVLVPGMLARGSNRSSRGTPANLKAVHFSSSRGVRRRGSGLTPTPGTLSVHRRMR